MNVEANVASTQEIQAALTEVLEGHPKVIAAWQFGSSLRADYVPGVSDIDILVVVADDSSLDDYFAIAGQVRHRIYGAEITILRAAEVAAAIHPGWSGHFYVNVSRSGVRLYGPDCLQGVRAIPLGLNEAYRRLTQLTQRARLVLINPSKEEEAQFWLRKYQHWIPLCLMELLDLAGTPEDRLRHAQRSFNDRFPDVGDVVYPYRTLAELTSYLESLVRWIPQHPESFSEHQP